jgi:broad specificity phosphatase PhoE
MQPEEVDARWPTDDIREQDLPRGESGETFAALSRRTLAAVDDIHRLYGGQTVVVICHGGNVRAALMATPAPLEDGTDPRRAPIANTSVTVVQVNSAGLQATVIADVSHLDGAAQEMGETNADEQR